MMIYDFIFCDIVMWVLFLGVLYLLDYDMLCIFDLYFGKFEWMVCCGGVLLLFYENCDMLECLD